MKLRALRPLRGEYGSVVTGQIFEPRQEIAAELIKRGLVNNCDAEVKPAHPKKNKVAGPSETKTE